MARLGPKTRLYIRAVLRLQAAARSGLANLKRSRQLREQLHAVDPDKLTTREELMAELDRLEHLEGESNNQQIARVAMEDQLEEASREASRAHKDAEAAWNAGIERRPPLRWMIRKVGELDGIFAQLDSYLHPDATNRPPNAGQQ